MVPNALGSLSDGIDFRAREKISFGAGDEPLTPTPKLRLEKVGIICWKGRLIFFTVIGDVDLTKHLKFYFRPNKGVQNANLVDNP